MPDASSPLEPLDPSPDADALAPSATAGHAPSLPDRIRVSLHNRALDMRIAAGEPVAMHHDLAVRGWQLTRPRVRGQLADALERAVLDAEKRSESAGVCCEEVRDSRSELLWLASRLRGPETVAPRGVALTRELIVDGNSPLYARTGPRHRLARYLIDVVEALS